MRIDFFHNVMDAAGIGEGFSWSPNGAKNERTWWVVTLGAHTFNVRVTLAYRSGPLRMGDYTTLTEFTVWVADQSRAVKVTSKAEAETLMLQHSLTADNAEVTELSAHDRYEDVGGQRRIDTLARQ